MENGECENKMGNYFFGDLMSEMQNRYLSALIIDKQAFFQKRSEAKFKGRNN